MTTPSRARGNIEPRGNNKFRVRVYAGKDVVTGKPVYLKETVEGSKAAERKRTEFLRKVDEGKAAKSKCTFNYLLDSYFAQDHEFADKTLKDYKRLADEHLRPLFGELPLPKLQKDLVHTAESLYSDLAKCKRRCRGVTGLIDHRNPERTGPQLVTDLERHTCNRRCKPHECVPLAPTTIRHIHTVISGACAAADRWGWLSPNPASRIRQPKRPRPNPQAPTAEQAAAIVGEAFNEDVEWGTSIWLLMMVGDRRSGHIHIQVKDFDFEKNLFRVRHFKTQREQWVRLDDLSLMLAAEQIERIRQRRAKLGLGMTGEEYLHSYVPDNGKPGSPDYFTHRFVAMARRLGFHCTPHKLRHYTATELIEAKVAVSAIAERLGHSSGGRTTMNYYVAYRPESDDTAVEVLASRMPELPQVRNEKARPDYSAVQPRRTDTHTEELICALRVGEQLSPSKIKSRLADQDIDIAVSTVWLVLKRHGLNRANA